MIWFAMSVRVRPCSEREVRSSSGRVTSTWFSSSFTSMGLATVIEVSPFGPSTVTAVPSTLTSTPEGMSMGSRPIRDMELPHVGEDFSAYALLLGLAVGEQTAGSGQDRDAEAAEHLGELRRLRVDAEAGLGDALDASDRALAVRAELELEREGLADASIGHLEVGDVALLLQDLGDVRLELGVGHRHGVVVSGVGVPQTGQHVSDRVGHRHDECFLSFTRFHHP